MNAVRQSVNVSVEADKQVARASDGRARERDTDGESG